MIYLLQKFLIFSIPLRELAGFKSGIPFRLGELLMLAYAGYIFLNTSIEKKVRFFNRTFLSKSIVYLLILNLVLTIIFSRGQAINLDFFYKYVARNIMMILFFSAVLIRPIRLKRKDIELFFKYIVLLQLFMLILQKLGFTIKLFTLTSFPLGRRFQGTASEAGYLPTLIAPALWYFRNSIRSKKYYYLAFFEIFMTFSSFAYIVLALELGIVFFTKKIKINPKKFLKGILATFLVLIVVGMNFEVVSKSIENNFTKIMKYSKNNGGDFSAKARNEQLTNLKNKILIFDKEDFFFGKGTGAYFSSQLKYVGKNIFREITEEGHTLYYSTIHDRGILGYLVLISLFGNFGYMIYKQRKNRVIMCLAYLYLLQLIHWKITGNTWLYYFWISIAYVVSQYEIKEIGKRRRDRKKNGVNKYNNANLQKEGVIQ
ncbi:MAG: hypothetical protein ACRDDY_19175 [Clostridium sp.]|uniref:hypothetical protein n=1 Tax=Clostridium sp. TaxID=1506 RepID=UPI003EE7F254